MPMNDNGYFMIKLLAIGIAGIICMMIVDSAFVIYEVDSQTPALEVKNNKIEKELEKLLELVNGVNKR